MSVTIYTSADIDNIQKVDGFPPDNCSDSGTGINVHFTGTDSGALGVSCGFFTTITGDYNHSSPVTPIPTDARITKITLTFPTQYSLAGNATGSTATVSASCDIGNFFNDTADTPFPTAWITTDNKLALADSDDTGSMSAAASLGPAGANSSCVIDIAALPGDFPLGYMDYATFIANFSTFWFLITANSGGSKTSIGAGTGDASLDVETTNFTMEVEWDTIFLTNNITVSPDTVDVKDPIITIEAVDNPEVSGYEPGELSVGKIDKIAFNNPDGDCIVTEASPWIIIWWIEALSLTTEAVHQIRLRIAMCALETSEDVTILVHTNDAKIPDGSGGVVNFTGWVSLGTLTITYADLSGVYQLDDTVHNDTLYDRADTEAITTVTVAIPAPLFVTAFVGDDEDNISHYTGSRMRVTGAGLLGQIFQSLDTLNTAQLVDITLSALNNVSPFTISNFVDQHAALRVFQYGTIDDYMNVSKLIIFPRAIFTDYPQ